ncbi:MAG: hypothetical protein IJ079_05350 [Lachnospiraceae bacterium]|nr:hypothetical protein [Lachnospiraceae bacterium]
MQKIWLFIQNQSVFVYVIAGLAFFGVLTRLMLQGKLHRLLKASENMAMTKERNMKTIRNHYENNLNMDISVDHIEAFIEKYIFKLKYGGIPIHIWNSLTVECMILSVAAAFLGIIYAIHNSLPEEYIGQILIAVIIGCSVLLSVENYIRLEYFYERLEANIVDYLDNNLKSRMGRPLIKRRERSRTAGQGAGQTAIEQAAGQTGVELQDPVIAQTVGQATEPMASKVAAVVQEPATTQTMEQAVEQTMEQMPPTQNDRLIAVASEIANQLREQSYADTKGMVDRTKTGYEGRGNTRPATVKEVFDPDVPEDIPEYEIRRKATAHDQIAAGQEDYDAEIIAEVLRNFFSNT